MSPKTLLNQLHYIQKWRKGANLIQPAPKEISLAIDEAIRYIRRHERQGKDNSPLTFEMFINNGFRKVTDSICIGGEFTQLRSCDGKIIVSTNLSHTPGRPFYVSVDDSDMNSVGGLDCGTIYQYNSLLDLCDYPGERLTNNKDLSAN